MLSIPLVNGCPETHIPSDAVVSFLDGLNYYVYFDGDTIPPEHIPTYDEPPPETGWLTFRLGIFQDAAYQAITLAAHPLVAGRFETAVMADPPYLLLFPSLWAGVLQTSPEESHPTASDYQEWSALAESCHVGFSWTDEGMIELAS